MVNNKREIFHFLHAIIFVLSFITDWYYLLASILFALLIIQTLDKLGKGIVLRELIALHTSFVCLVMTMVGYSVFNKSNALSKLWVKHMPVEDIVYFSFVLPAVSGFVLVLCWPISNERKSDYGTSLMQVIIKARSILQYYPKTGIYLLCTGIIMLYLSDVVPDSIKFIFLLFYFASFTGFLYVYYSSASWYRIPVLIFFMAFIVLSSLRSGMFTIVAYMSLTLFSFFFVGKRSNFFKKLLWFIAGAFFLIMIQSVKPEYRRLTWKEDYSGSKAELFTDLVLKKISDFEWRNIDAFFPVYARTNQGFNIALVMQRTPTIMPYDDGDKLFLSFASALVPRVFWQDKPEAGGKANMQYYAGVKITSWSTNVGPLGEAYGSFGRTGGIIYMFILGFFLRWAYSFIFLLSRKNPLLIFWIPVLFYEATYSAETDSLQILNSILKSGFFVFVLHKLIPEWFARSRNKIGTPASLTMRAA